MVLRQKESSRPRRVGPTEGDSPIGQGEGTPTGPSKKVPPSVSYVPSHKEEYLEGEEGEYVGEEMKVDVNPPWF